jgi:2-polyprenyl-3-methyl-5-hydroxy-6-metoxy-1,4-benzoquinol methylase
VLDIGCWIGWYEYFMVKKGCKSIVAIDIDINALQKAQENVSALNCDFVRASATNLPFKPQSFDGVSMWDVLEHLPVNSEYDCFNQINRLIPKDGFVLISVPNSHFLSRILDPAYFLIGHRHYNRIDIQKFMQKTRFEIHAAEYGGGIVEALSVILLYFCKRFLKIEIPFKSAIEYLRDKEYQTRGFETLFIEAIKTGS